MSIRLAPSGACVLCLALVACDRAESPLAGAPAVRSSSSSSLPPVVTSAAPPPPRARLFATRATDVLASPSATASTIGRLTLGAWIEPSGDIRARDEACPDGYLPIAPSGFVCRENALAPAENAAASVFVAEHLGAVGRPYPASYGESLGAVVYSGVPSQETQKKAEPALEAQRAMLASARRAALLGRDEAIPAVLLGVDFTTPADPCAAFLLREGDATVRETLPKGAQFGWIAECEAAERTWLVTAELDLIPRDRVARLVASAAHGAESPAPPVGPRAAFVTGPSRPRYVMVRYGFFGVAPDPLPAGTIVWLTGQTRALSGLTYLETTHEGEYVLADHIVQVRPTQRPPSIGATERWIDVQAAKGLLVAYQGDAPVYATLCSAPPSIVTDVGAQVASRGRFRVEWKHRARTFGEGAKQKRDFPHAQMLGDSLALVGDPGGLARPGASAMVRVSPIDAAWLFAFTTPSVPEGFSARRREEPAPGTWVQIRD